MTEEIHRPDDQEAPRAVLLANDATTTTQGQDLKKSCRDESWKGEEDVNVKESGKAGQQPQLPTKDDLTKEQEPYVREGLKQKSDDENVKVAAPVDKPVVTLSLEKAEGCVSSEMPAGVARYLQLRMAESPFFKKNSGSSLPVLDVSGKNQVGQRAICYMYFYLVLTFAHLNGSEINLGNLLGQGEFGRVREVVEIHDKAGHLELSRLLKQGRPNGSGSLNDSEPSVAMLASSKMADNSEGEESSWDAEAAGPFHTIKEDDSDASIEFVEIEHARRARKILKKRCWREGRARYAVKQLKEELLVPAADGEEWHMGIIGAMDLAMEAALLSSLSHPNIVKLRATAGVPGRPDYMLVMDRLYTTLDHQIAEWKLELPKASAFQQLLGKQESWSLGQSLSLLKLKKGVDVINRKTSSDKHNRKIAKQLLRQGQLLNRLYAAFDAARALRFLHENKIVYRVCASGVLLIELICAP